MCGCTGAKLSSFDLMVWNADSALYHQLHMRGSKRCELNETRGVLLQTQTVSER